MVSSIKYLGIVGLVGLMISQKQALDRLIAELSLHPLSVKPSVWIATIVLVGVTAFSGWQAALTINRYRRQFTWKVSLRSMSWILYVVNAVFIVLGLLTSISPPDRGPLAGIMTVSVVEVVVSIVVGIHAAILFSPEDEPLLELKLSYPRPFIWLILERVGIVLLIHSTIALIGTLWTQLILKDANFMMLLLRWLVPMLFMAGVALRVTLTTRQIVFGAMTVTFLWIGIGYFGNFVLNQYPFLWPLHTFLEPERLAHSDYLLNRLMVALLGITLIISAVYKLRNDEFVMTGKG